MRLMNPDNRRDKNNRTAKAITAMPMAGIVIAAALLLTGLSLVSSYHPALAQQNMTGGGGNATNATTTGAVTGATQSEAMMHLEEVRTALQNNDIQGAMMHLDLAMNVLSGGTQGNMTSATGSTNSTA
jgi:ABC-type lipoprotein release transport system permease subunit